MMQVFNRRTTLAVSVTAAILIMQGCETDQSMTRPKEPVTGKEEVRQTSEMPEPGQYAVVLQDEYEAGNNQRSEHKAQPSVALLQEQSSIDSGKGSSDAMSESIARKQERLIQGSQLTASKRASNLAIAVAPSSYHQLELANRENYAHLPANSVKQVSREPVSTFSIDVDSGSYSIVRRMLTGGQLPPADAVRIEEMINYFDYQYPLPDSTRQPFSVSTELAPAPWDSRRQLLRVGLQGYEVPAEQRPASNLVFLVDVSGSMHAPDKLPLLKRSLQLLTQRMSNQDRISLVVYAGASGVVLAPTAGDKSAEIGAALANLRAGGSTNGAAGIKLAYQLAQQAFISNGINRVILATDGDFNVGTVDHEALKNLIEVQRDKGISLTTLGFGSGNYNDHLMEQLADVGNGNYAYIDTMNEARKVLVDELGATLQTIAGDVKIQIEFNPNKVSEYRLIGYENRMLKSEDFNNDRVDAGEIGAGHNVTALYELTMVSSGAERIDPLRYGASVIDDSHEDIRNQDNTGLGRNNELAHLRLRYKLPGEHQSRLIERPLTDHQLLSSIQQASDGLRFSASVAAFGQLLKGGQYTGSFGFDDVARLAAGSRGDDLFGYRGEFLQLVHTARALTAQPSGQGVQPVATGQEQTQKTSPQSLNYSQVSMANQ